MLYGYQCQPPHELMQCPSLVRRAFRLTPCSNAQPKARLKRSLTGPPFHGRNINRHGMARASMANGSNEEVLKHLQTLSTDKLKDFMDRNGDNVTLSFFEWLASREDQLEGSSKVELGVLAGQLMAIKEGLEPLSFDQVADDLQQHWEAAQSKSNMPANQPDTGQLAATNSSSSSSNNIDSSSRSSSSSVAGHNATEASPNDALARTGSSHSNFQLMQPFSVTSIAQDDLKVTALQLDVRQARANSTVQVIGRKDLSAGAHTGGPQAVSNAAHRILEYLLQLHSAELRREVLPDAFESQPEASQQGYEESSEGHEGENEQLSTTPLQLLQAIDLELARLSRGTSGMLQGQNLLPGGNAKSVQDVQAALQQLRQDVLECWQAE